ncbi:MAG: hypothetical protein WC423_26255, partial [Vulcanimicrobiota bacterium]
MAGSKQKVLEVLKSGLPTSEQLVLLSGDDEYLHDLLLRKLEQDLIDPDFRDFNFRRVDCNRTTTAGALAGVLSELPTLVDNRMVVLNRVKELTKPVSSRLAEVWNESVAPGTVAVLTAGGAVGDSP